MSIHIPIRNHKAPQKTLLHLHSWLLIAFANNSIHICPLLFANYIHTFIHTYNCGDPKVLSVGFRTLGAPVNGYVTFKQKEYYACCCC